jgi:hypothetical protein
VFPTNLCRMDPSWHFRYSSPRGQSTAISGEVDLTGGLVAGVQSNGDA